MSPIRALSISFALLALSLAQACTRATTDVSAPQAATAAPPTATSAPARLPTKTPEPTQTPPPPPTLGPAMLQSKYLDIACRFGYGKDWSQEATLVRNTPAPILGRNNDSSWWNIAQPGDALKTCWVPAHQTQAEGDLSAIPHKVQSTAIVGHVSVDIDPDEETIACFAFPFEFQVKTTIGVTGPTRITLTRSDSVNGARPTETRNLDNGRSWVLLDRIRLNGPGDVWFQVLVSGPNEMVAEASARVECE